MPQVPEPDANRPRLGGARRFHLNAQRTTLAPPLGRDAPPARFTDVGRAATLYKRERLERKNR